MWPTVRPREVKGVLVPTISKLNVFLGHCVDPIHSSSGLATSGKDPLRLRALPQEMARDLAAMHYQPERQFRACTGLLESGTNLIAKHNLVIPIHD